MKAEEEIKKLVTEGKIIAGAERTIKAIKSGTVKKVFVSSNCPADVKEDVEQYAKMGAFEVVELSQPNDEVGAMCKKPFPISIFCTQK